LLDKLETKRTYNVTLRRVHATIFERIAMGITYSVCVICSLSYPACNAHVPCYIVFGLPGCAIFNYIISQRA
jgi:hypothetical protein